MADDDGIANQPDYLSGTAAAADEPLTCTSCGRLLGDSGDDQPDWPGGPLCGDCYQARQMDDEIWWSEQEDGT